MLGGTVCLGFAEEGEDDLDLFWGEEFALGGVVGGLEGGHQWLIGVDFTGEEFSCALLAAVGEIGYSKVLLELVMHNNEKLNETIGPRAGIRIKEKFILCIESPARPEKESHGRRDECLPWL